MPTQVCYTKPNDEKMRCVWDAAGAFEQIKSNELVAVLKLHQKGFTGRQPFDNLVSRYKRCCPDTGMQDALDSETRRSCQHIIDALGAQLDTDDPLLS